MFCRVEVDAHILSGLLASEGGAASSGLSACCFEILDADLKMHDWRLPQHICRAGRTGSARMSCGTADSATVVLIGAPGWVAPHPQPMSTDSMLVLSRAAAAGQRPRPDRSPLIAATSHRCDAHSRTLVP